MSEQKDTSARKVPRKGFHPVRAWKSASPRTRRGMKVVGVLAVLAFVFVVIPTYIAVQPAFSQRFPKFDSQYHSWSTSIHAGVPCRKCHVPPTLAAQAGYSVRMLGAFYASLVAPGSQPALFKKPTNAACRSCHVDLRTVSPSGDLNIPHQAHVVVLKMQCVTCHKYLVHQANPEGTHTPRMATCLTCHNGARAKNACSTCHTNKDIPANHRAANWVVVHPQMLSKIDCNGCHKWTANWCAECHSHRPRSHGPNWRTEHGTAVKTHRNCEACHPAAFCVRCHGDLPQLNFNPGLKLVTGVPGGAQ